MFLVVGSQSRVSAFALWARDALGLPRGLLGLSASMAFITEVFLLMSCLPSVLLDYNVLQLISQ